MAGARAGASRAPAHFRGPLSKVFFLALSFCGPAIAAPVCAPDRIDVATHVADVYDGDTVYLAAGARLRLIGLDAPELGRDGAPDQPFAAAARDALRRRLAGNAALRLRYDAEREDVHGRTLAHAFFADGDSVAAWLLEQGLATLLVIPPNVWNADCYAAAERRARVAKRGVWASPDHLPVAADTLAPAIRGYRTVRGRVLRVHDAPRAVWLALPGRFAIRIDRADLGHFAAVPLYALHRREVVVRGLVYPVGEEPHLKLRHPAQLDWPAR